MSENSGLSRCKAASCRWCRRSQKIREISSRRCEIRFEQRRTRGCSGSGPTKFIASCFHADAKPAFVRFDLNPKDHHNEDEGLRSHVHPGSDDFSAPAPLMSPIELLDVLVYNLRVRRPPRA
jgi:hypothetical protein